jgi:hypothetical protein
MDEHDHYKIISSVSADHMAQVANNMAKDGWIPCGGIVFAQGRAWQSMWHPPLPEIVKIKMEAATNMEPITK